MNSSTLLSREDCPDEIFEVLEKEVLARYKEYDKHVIQVYVCSTCLNWEWKSAYPPSELALTRSIVSLEVDTWNHWQCRACATVGAHFPSVVDYVQGVLRVQRLLFNAKLKALSTDVAKLLEAKP